MPSKSYSQGVLVPHGRIGTLYVTGQLPQNMEGEIIHTGDPVAQTKLVFSRISDILAEAGMHLDDVVKLQIYANNKQNIKIISSVRDEIFAQSKPASTFVVVSGFVKEGSCVEIDAIAARI